MLSHPEGLPIAVTFDYDCDGLSIGYHDCDKTDRLPYGAKKADEYISREHFLSKILPTIQEDEFHYTYWFEVGYYGDSSGIRNCEISRPVEPRTLSALQNI